MGKLTQEQRLDMSFRDLYTQKAVMSPDDWNVAFDSLMLEYPQPLVSAYFARILDTLVVAQTERLSAYLEQSSGRVL